MHKYIQQLDTNTAISIGLVITLLCASVGFGITYNQVQQTQEELRELKIAVNASAVAITDLRILLAQHIAYQPQ